MMGSNGKLDTDHIPVAGILTPNGWLDPTPDYFRACVAEPAIVQQTMMTASSYEFTLENIARSEPEMCVAARSLWQAECDAIVLTGTPFTFAGDPTEQGARARQARISDMAGGVPVVLPGLSIIEACRALGCSRPACSTTYYPADWRAAWGAFLTDAGLPPLNMLSLDQLGMAGEIGSVSQDGWTLTSERIAQAGREVFAKAPEADCVLIGGAGASTRDLVHDLEDEFGVPVIGADGIMVWGLARALSVELTEGCLGALTHARPGG